MGGLARIGLSQEPDSLFPGMQAMASAADILGAMTTRPLHYDDRGRAHPRVLRRIPTPGRGWEFLPGGGMRITYHWKRGYRWHDGVPLTTQDAVWTWRLRMDPRVQIDSRWYDPQIEDMQCPDPYTLVVTWKRRLATANHYYLMLPRHVLEPAYLKDPAGFHLLEFGKRPLTTGPFRFVEWRPKDRIDLSAVPDFCEGRPPLDGLSFRFIPDPEEMAAALLRGDLDVMATNNLTLGQAARLAEAGRGRVCVHFTPSLAVERIDFNLDHPHLGRREVRHALAWAVDRSRVVAAATGGKGRLADSWLPERHRGYKAQRLPGGDARRAAELLKGCGFEFRDGTWADGDGKPLSFTITTTAGDPARIRAAAELKEQWRAFGAAVEVREDEPRRVFGEFARRREFDLLLYAWLMHPDTIGRGAWHSQQVPGPENGYSGHNFAGWRNPEVDELLARAEEEFDERRRWELLHRQQELFARDLPSLPLYHRIEVSAHRVGLLNFRPGGSSQTPVTWNAHRWRWGRAPARSGMEG
ncbi:MAG: peptide ABC transporter substrate-binding protein [Acetobacteraceae bacterium]|nr:peptide ABC transporter substrate-binding protein [Acetobacteraceae bacterium]